MCKNTVDDIVMVVKYAGPVPIITAVAVLLHPVPIRALESIAPVARETALDAPMFRVPDLADDFDLSAPGSQVPSELSALYWGIAQRATPAQPPQELEAHSRAVLRNIIGVARSALQSGQPVHALLTPRHAAVLTGRIGLQSQVDLHDLADPAKHVQVEITERILDALEPEWTGYAKSGHDSILQLHRKLAEQFDAAAKLSVPVPAPMVAAAPSGANPAVPAERGTAPARLPPQSEAGLAAFEMNAAALDPKDLRILALLIRRWTDIETLLRRTRLDRDSLFQSLLRLEALELIVVTRGQFADYGYAQQVRRRLDDSKRRSRLGTPALTPEQELEAAVLLVLEENTAASALAQTVGNAEPARPQDKDPTTAAARGGAVRPEGGGKTATTDRKAKRRRVPLTADEKVSIWRVLAMASVEEAEEATGLEKQAVLVLQEFMARRFLTTGEVEEIASLDLANAVSLMEHLKRIGLVDKMTVPSFAAGGRTLLRSIDREPWQQGTPKTGHTIYHALKPVEFRPPARLRPGAGADGGRIPSTEAWRESIFELIEGGDVSQLEEAGLARPAALALLELKHGPLDPRGLQKIQGLKRTDVYSAIMSDLARNHLVTGNKVNIGGRMRTQWRLASRSASEE
ncbi:MAG: hypothetical protein HY552_01420 [Elusimicrobia bacterium]|nr:hypothetical protein [Elusimicrobiota bacterium]